VLLGEGHVSQNVLLGAIPEGRELGQLAPHLVGDVPPLGLGRRMVRMGEDGGDEG